ncbi:conserved hypothetical protein [Tenacibaculum sp. 190524A02b]|uniref:Uncharacterized protein n=1 Tax=Tenacibaculum vairaonense TaxID=3137860 RepID=A0ABP1F4W6_9FLAO
MKDSEKKVLESLKPQMKYFEVLGLPRVYISPRLGRIDLRLSFSNEKALECYKDINFPYLALKEGAEELLKKEKVETILFLINKATRKKDLEILTKSKPESKKVKELAEKRIKHLP